MTWLVRDWGSCFKACMLPIDDHELASSHRVPERNISFTREKKKRFKSIYNNKMPKPSKKCNNKRQLNNPMTKNKDGVPVGNRHDDPSLSLSTDEDYIVFCVGENDAFDVVKDDKHVMSEARIRDPNAMHKNSSPVNRKLKYCEDVEQVSDLNINEKRPNANQQDTDQDDQYYIIHLEEDKKEEMVYNGSQQHADSIRRECHIVEIEELEMVSAEESRNSDQSEDSSNTGSFTFPVLGWERIGSPERMPKSEGLHLKKQRGLCDRFQCCRF
ncbi:protein BREAKING OF ASYMMETRY IN THE STOMATAL LINEAGE [Gastrolobium bilobum]|uniref:protein BREAKING OF ASYMMETRY IN THE STOMATAL LINEAGE n=1 Tax=Gastrolobium bilobum TaxID=150636 RepID=UPI002AB19D8B|nr:protein BREAKING OF ASYMMETRY IN THE STOMATAL LINEAGE [Gastrolobium bilobum]